METEFVAEANPYTDKLERGMPVRLLYRGAPRANAQVEVFARSADKTVTISIVRTDTDGHALIPVARGVEYMLDAVVMRPIEAADPEKKPVWESLWAGMTFKIPE